MALENEPDVVISDVVMPILDGTDLCRRIMDTMSQTNFILISAYEDFATAQLGMAKNVQDYIVKPIAREKLNYICDQLVLIREKVERRDFFRKILFSDSFETDLFAALDQPDDAELRKLFHTISSESMRSVDDGGVIQDVCLRLIRILFRYLERKGISDDRSQQYEESIRHIESMKLKADMILYVADLYLNMHEKTKKEVGITETVINGIRDYIDMHYADPDLNCAYLSRVFHYSQSYISRMFSMFYRITPANYILQVRLNAACYMLSCENSQISQIAASAGFENSNYFAKVFRQKMKI